MTTIANAPSGENTSPVGTEKIPLSGDTFIQISNLIARKLRETSGPTTLNMGAVNDGEFLRRSGTDIIGVPYYPAAEGYTTNCVITPSISSNNLIVALKGINGSDPSATNVINTRIGGANRQITSALSVQVNAGSSVFALGGSDFAGLKQQLFVYLGWRASTSTVFIMLSRYPNGRTYADFSATSTNEKYGAYSGAAPASTDVVNIIGRIDVQNSGSASFNWSLPSGAFVVNRPIWETDWLDWSPALVGFSAPPTTTLYRYTLSGGTSTLFVRQNADGTSNATNFTISLPFTARTIANMAWGGAGVVSGSGVVQTTPGVLRVLTGATVMDVYPNFSPGTGFPTSGGKRLAQMNPLVYEI